jgi:hypothetical protein
MLNALPAKVAFSNATHTTNPILTGNLVHRIAAIDWVGVV